MRDIYDALVPMVYNKSVELEDFLQIFKFTNKWKLGYFRQEEHHWVREIHMYPVIYHDGELSVFSNKINVSITGGRFYEFYDFLTYYELFSPGQNMVLIQKLLLTGV